MLGDFGIGYCLCLLLWLFVGFDCLIVVVFDCGFWLFLLAVCIKFWCMLLAFMLVWFGLGVGCYLLSCLFAADWVGDLRFSCFGF